VCTDGYRATYAGLLPAAYIERVIAEYYNLERLRREVESPEGWHGWWVAEEAGRVVGAGGGGMTGPASCELFVLYLDPSRRGEGVGSLLLEAITRELRAEGCREQWVSVTRGNQKAIPFYRARGFIEKGERPAHGTDPSEHIVSVRMARAL
jgi:GNAT superfamily N-acetyltransferase